MAKPGSGAARQIAGGRDLGGLALSDEQALERQGEIELQAGMRCGGCGRRVGLGFRFTSIDPRATDLPALLQMSACSREGCDFSVRAREGATMVEQIEFVWLDPRAMAAPAVKRIAERRAAAATSDSS